MIRFFKRYFIEILFIVLIVCIVYVQRDWLFRAYSDQVDLHLKKCVNDVKDKNDLANLKSFAEKAKDNFLYQLDRLIAFALGGFGILIIMQFNKKNKTE